MLLRTARLPPPPPIKSTEIITRSCRIYEPLSEAGWFEQSALPVPPFIIDRVFIYFSFTRLILFSLPRMEYARDPSFPSGKSSINLLIGAEREDLAARYVSEPSASTERLPSMIPRCRCDSPWNIYESTDH